MKPPICPRRILVVSCLLVFLGVLAWPQVPAPTPSLEDLKRTNVSLELVGFDFASGLRPGPDGKPNRNGVEMVESRWAGSGFIIGNDGTVVTNYHVARKAQSARAIFEDQSYFDITQIKSYDPVHDIAILKIRAQKPFPTVKLGNSDTVNVMDRVLAVGNALNQRMAVTEGMINQVFVDDNNSRYQLRHSATIAPGNSGGALYRGDEVIGINVSGMPGLSIYYSIPINIVRPLLDPKFTGVLLTQAFPADLEAIAGKAKQFFAQNGRVPGTTKEGTGSIGYSVDVPQLSDILLHVECPGRNLCLMAVSESDGKVIGIGDLPVMDQDLLILNSENASRISVFIVNFDKQPANFALTGNLILW